MTASDCRHEIAVEVLCVEGCPNCQSLLGDVETLLARTGQRARVEVRTVRSTGQARALRFLGSPTLRVNGRDVEPEADVRSDYALGCRLYRSDATVSGKPSHVLIARALKAAAASDARGSGHDGSSCRRDEFGRPRR